MNKPLLLLTLIAATTSTHAFENWYIGAGVNNHDNDGFQSLSLETVLDNGYGIKAFYDSAFPGLESRPENEKYLSESYGLSLTKHWFAENHSWFKPYGQVGFRKEVEGNFSPRWCYRPPHYHPYKCGGTYSREYDNKLDLGSTIIS